MIRIVTLLLLAMVIVVVAGVAVAIWASGAGAQAGKLSGVQKVAYACLLAVMGGISVGWLGVD